MSFVVARMAKMKAGNLGGAYRHVERVFKNHGNKDINPELTKNNYELTDRNRAISFEKQIKDYVNENKASTRAIRKDAVLCAEWIVSASPDFFKDLSQEETRQYFQTAVDFYAERYGKENIAYASVHLDESTPHMHMGIVPLKDGKLSSKTMFTKTELVKIQTELPDYLASKGFNVVRGQEKSQAKHLSVKEYKEMADSLKALEAKIERYNVSDVAELQERTENISKKLDELPKHLGKEVISKDFKAVLKRMFNEFVEELKTLRNKLQSLTDENKGLKKQIGSYQEDNRTLDKQNRTLKAKLVTKNEALKEAKKFSKFQNDIIKKIDSDILTEGQKPDFKKMLAEELKKNKESKKQEQGLERK